MDGNSWLILFLYLYNVVQALWIWDLTLRLSKERWLKERQERLRNF